MGWPRPFMNSAKMATTWQYFRNIRSTFSPLLNHGRFSKETMVAFSSTAAAPGNGVRQDRLGSVYNVRKSELSSMLLQGYLPLKLKNKADAYGKVSWILREPAWKVINSLKKGGGDRGKRFLFYGPDDCGKSVCLLQTVHYCLSNNWIVLYIPSVFKWTHSRSELKGLVQYERLFDIPEETNLWLQLFKGMNNKIISQLTLSQDYVWNKNDTARAGDSLLKTVEQGISKPKVSSDVFYTVFNELSQLKSHSVLLAVDDLNGCFCPTSFNKEKVEPDEIHLVRTLLQYLDPQKFRGSVVAALSRKLMRNLSTAGTGVNDLLSGEKAQLLSKSFETVKVSTYSKDELNVCLRNYSKEKWMNKELDEQTISELWTLSGGVPGELERICGSI